jgi:bacterioferritin (cytochrome b1)
MTNKDLIRLLSEDLQNEYNHMMFYLRASVEVQGLHRAEIREFLLKEAQEELLHVEEFSRMIKYLGGSPDITALFNYSAGQNPRDILDEVVRMERLVANNYAARLRMTEEMTSAEVATIHVFYEDQIKNSQYTAWEVEQMISEFNSL